MTSVRVRRLRAKAGEYDESPPLGDALAALPIDEFPLTVPVAGAMGGSAPTGIAGSVLDGLLAGIAARSTTDSAARARRG